MDYDLGASPTHTLGEWHPHPPNDPLTTARPPWTYHETDSAIALFTAAMERFRMTFPPGCRILELGCAETNWLELMAAWDASFQLTGVDARAHVRPNGSNVPIIVGSAMDVHLFEPESFDRIVLLGALEHFGLGFYGDPQDDRGDTQTMENVARWLVPHGLVYFDVPVQPEFMVSENRCFRSYRAGGDGPGKDVPGTISARCLPPGLFEVNRGYSLPEPHAGTWCSEPTENRVPYWYCAVLAEKR